MRFTAALLVLLAGCANPPETKTETETETASQVAQCAAVRPQICTMEYDPVCATLVGGGSATYSSPCNACAHDAVTGYLRGACPE